jgi:hypothetical protein
MSVKRCLYLFNTGHSACEIVKMLKLSEAEALDITIKVTSWLE